VLSTLWSGSTRHMAMMGYWVKRKVPSGVKVRPPWGGRYIGHAAQVHQGVARIGELRGEHMRPLPEYPSGGSVPTCEVPCARGPRTGRARSYLKIILRAAPGPFPAIHRCSTLTERPAMRGFRASAGRKTPPARYQKLF
jgi:hypothetical protein